MKKKEGTKPPKIVGRKASDVLFCRAVLATEKGQSESLQRPSSGPLLAVIVQLNAGQKKKKCQFTELPKGAGHTAVIFFSALDRAVNMENNDEPLLRASVAVPPSSCMQTIGSGIKLTTIFESKKYGSARRWQEAGETSSGCSHFNFRLPPSFFDPDDSHRLTTCSIGSDSCRPTLRFLLDEKKSESNRQLVNFFSNRPTNSPRQPLGSGKEGKKSNWRVHVAGYLLTMSGTFQTKNVYLLWYWSVVQTDPFSFIPAG